MSTPEVRRRYVRTNRRRKAPLNVDLNAPPVDVFDDAMEMADIQTLADLIAANPDGAGASASGSGAPPSQPPPSQQPPTIDVEAIDDEVVISSPRRFAEARKKSRRNHNQNQNGSAVNHEVAMLINHVTQNNAGYIEDEDITSLSLNAGTRRRIPLGPTIIDLESNYSVRDTVRRSREPVLSMLPPPPPPPPPPAPKEPTFSCPICMGQLVEEASTKCGHIFCKKCIKAAITAQSKCPTCRKKLTQKDVIRVYLPTTN